MNIDFFMKEAINEAKLAFYKNEVPVGGVLVDNSTKKIISKSHNKINELNNPIQHCELNLIIEGCKIAKSKYLNHTTLFVTLEPCIMCAAAISESHISKVYFGAYDEKNGGIEKYKLVYKRENIFFPEIYGGILEDDCNKIINLFFLKIRK